MNFARSSNLFVMGGAAFHVWHRWKDDARARTMARAFEILSNLDVTLDRKDTPPQSRKGL